MSMMTTSASSFSAMARATVMTDVAGATDYSDFAIHAMPRAPLGRCPSIGVPQYHSFC
jgi:hypothetical protein